MASIPRRLKSERRSIGKNLSLREKIYGKNLSLNTLYSFICYQRPLPYGAVGIVRTDYVDQ